MNDEFYEDVEQLLFVVQVLLTKILSIDVKMLSIARYIENIVKIS